MLTDEQIGAWWRLSRLPRVGNLTLNAIRQSLPHSTDLLQLTSDELQQLELNAELAHRWQHDSSLNKGVETLLHWRQQAGCDLLLAGVPPYPDSLATLPDAPLFLFARGHLSALDQPRVAMVGSRNPSRYGSDWAQHNGAVLANCGLTVVSGLALGIDGASHQGAVSQGRSIAVLGCGADIIYPRRHQTLAMQLLEHGLILSEFLPGTAPRAPQFPSRNRIISGLSMGVVVVEAALRSGSLITAQQAAEQGREVMAVPGAVNNPLSQGCHQLIRDGATLVQHADDVLQQLGIFGLTAPDAPSVPNSPAVNSAATPEQWQPGLLSCIDFAPTAVDVIAIRSQLDVAQLLPQLLELELSGWLAQSAGGFMRLR
ncbi:DNA-protecting protein DprA [Bacterioplanes sanyensis]|uniref:DNA-protecting protein DprA n=1 Tax=Bacterioplanes sanyensis TaxID=1249553 RepID=A0A222FH86_9GAMM|nr:DNA-processing protein DprA [Bacterioplanes sanyensis]ASP37992.1 DNA-protecting protein DprA [Bacterioplanes sanyensis]